MHVAVGSQNPTKVAAVEATLEDVTATPTAVESGVSEQPTSISETITGSRNRARRAIEATDVAYGCGLEGGVAEIEGLDQPALIMWATATDGSVSHSGGGPVLPLPDDVVTDLGQGRTLGAIIDDIADTNGLAERDGAIGLFTGRLTDRTRALGEAVACAFGPLLTDHYASPVND